VQPAEESALTRSKHQVQSIAAQLNKHVNKASDNAKKQQRAKK